jgi:hypothetical protein
MAEKYEKGKVRESKRNNNGLIQIVDSSIYGWRELRVDGKIKEQSADHEYIKKQYDKY